jgi:hypothetical protein
MKDATPLRISNHSPAILCRSPKPAAISKKPVTNAQAAIT